MGIHVTQTQGAKPLPIPALSQFWCGGRDELGSQQIGQPMVVRGDGVTEERRTFIDAIDPGIETIVVQEEWAEAYETTG